MVRRLESHGKPVYTCEVCGFLYLERSWAERCQEHAIQSVALLTA
jgi:hypothetical protein